MKKWQQIIAGLAVGAAVLGVFVGPGLVLADDYGLSATAGAAKIPTDKNVQTIIGNVIGTALSMISVLFFALMLYAGIKWMLARGDSDEARKALDTIIAAIIGMLVVLGSYAITNFVFGTLGQTNPAGSGKPSVPQSGVDVCHANATAKSTCTTAKTEKECTDTIFPGADYAECSWSGGTCSEILIDTLCNDNKTAASCSEESAICSWQ